MKVAGTHISYCTNIHSGELWADHFEQLRQHVPAVKAQVSPDRPFGIGLRLSARAAKDLQHPAAMRDFKDWLAENDLYVFTMNGFPFGDFHLESVKDKVHAPDWTAPERRDYTKSLFGILAALLPEGEEGGVSTSPLSYRHWFDAQKPEWTAMRRRATRHVIEVADHLHQLEDETGKYMHLDIEPEPDGVLEDVLEFVGWYLIDLLPQAQRYFYAQYGFDADRTKELLTRHITICYDVCHAALNYADHALMIELLERLGIRIGKFQISSALKVDFSFSLADRKRKMTVLRDFDEPMYLHQVVAKKICGGMVRYRDLQEALSAVEDLDEIEWRSHFHVPIFLGNYGEISSTQQDILRVLELQKQRPRTRHIEVETYTWAVLPEDLQMPIQDSISREIGWLLENS